MTDEKRDIPEPSASSGPRAQAEPESTTAHGPATPGKVPLSPGALEMRLGKQDEEEPPSPFEAGPVRFSFVRALEERSNGVQVLLFERHLRHGLSGPVIVKRLVRPRTLERRERLKEEVQLAFRLSHPAIAQVYHLRMIEQVAHVIMEHVDGPTLESLVNVAALRELPLPVPFALYVAAEVADALHHAHTLKDAEAGRPLGIIHRDVSPRNIRISRRTGAVKLTDFGAAFSKRVGREETPGLLLKGDLLYASPEYVLGAPQMDARSDVFSLGLVLLEALTSKNLFYLRADTAEPPRAPASQPRADEAPSVELRELMALMREQGPEHVERLVGELPEGLKAILHRALRARPEERYGTAEELRHALREQLTALAPGYGRQEVLQETERLISAGTGLRHVAELFDPGIVPSHFEEHELL